MPDSQTAKSTRIRPRTASGARRRRRSPISDVQIAVQEAAAELRRLDRRLAEISEGLPQANGELDLLSELRGAIDCVRSDLLSDAIATLDTAATARESDLRCRFTERQGWLAAVEA